MKIEKQGALYFTEGKDVEEEEIELKEFIENDNWKLEKLKELISKEITHIVENIKPITKEINDKAWWMGNSTREFTVKSPYHLLKHKKDPIEWINCIWIKGLPFKIFFCIWRVWN